MENLIWIVKIKKKCLTTVIKKRNYKATPNQVKATKILKTRKYSIKIIKKLNKSQTNIQIQITKIRK